MSTADVRYRKLRKLPPVSGDLDAYLRDELGMRSLEDDRADELDRAARREFLKFLALLVGLITLAQLCFLMGVMAGRG